MNDPQSKLLAIDIGNSRISCGMFRQGVLVESWHYPTDNARSAGRLLTDQAKEAQIAISSVVPEAFESLRSELNTNGHGPLDVRAHAIKMVRGTYSTIGSDRLANAVAGWKLYGQSDPVVVIDMGTATTLTAVHDGEFKGGWITLGLGKTLSSLHTATAQLPSAIIRKDLDKMPARDTESAIVNGTVLGHIAMLDQWIKMARKSLGGKVSVVATGGWSEIISRHTASIDQVDASLTLKGIYLIAAAAMVPGDRG